MKPHEIIEWVVKLTQLHYGVTWRGMLCKQYWKQTDDERYARKVAIHLISVYTDDETACELLKIKQGVITHASAFYRIKEKEVSHIAHSVNLLMKQAA